MAQGNNSNFLAIPSQEGLFKTVRVDRSEDNSNDEDEEETEEDVRLIPRSSPIPRKRGSSIADETAEYMRIRLVLTNRRVSFADSLGAELVDVRLFVPFDSDEEDNSKWEEEEEKYQRAYREPIYRLWPEFQVLSGAELSLAVHSKKLEVESFAPVPDEPLSFSVLIRVLNISFHKSVCVRATMDGWINHFDYPAEYVQGSNDGETDQFSVKLSFAQPYLFNGARIDFVVRYESSEGEFWANNSGRNYSVSLIESYEEDTTQASVPEKEELRGILKPPRYSGASNYDDTEDTVEDLNSTDHEVAENRSYFEQPTIVQPEIDIETAKILSRSPESTETPSTTGCSQLRFDTPFGELPLKSKPCNNLPHIKGSRLHQSVPSAPVSQQVSEAQDETHNVLPSLSFSLPTVIIEFCDGSEINKCELEDSKKPKQKLSSKMLAQVPFEYDQPPWFPETPHSKEEILKNLEKNKATDVDFRLEDLSVEQTQTVEQKPYLHIIEEFKEPLHLKEKTPATEHIKPYDLSKDVDDCLKEGIREQNVDLISEGVVTPELVEEESTKMYDEETVGLLASCLSLPCFGAAAHEGETQSFLIHTKTPEEVLQFSFSEAAPKKPSINQHPPNQVEMCELFRLPEESQTDLQLSACRSSVGYFMSERDGEAKQSLPSVGSQISKDKTEANLSTCLMVFVTCLSAVICLAVGIQEPSVFLCVGLFMLSLWF